MLLGANGQNIYPEEIEAKLNNLPYISESLVVQRNNRLIALVYPDYAALKDDDISEQAIDAIMESNRTILNTTIARYERINDIEISKEEFEKTPKKSIKRFLYS